VHGEATAILAALGFINRAYALAGFALAPWPLPIRCQAHAALDACLGVTGLTGGQARDLNYAETRPTARETSAIARAKTTPLLLLAVLLPALAGGAGTAELAELRALTLYWGLAFQALDDLSDLLTTSVGAGKTTGRDRALARPNLALALGVPETRRRLGRLILQAEQRIARLAGARPAWVFLDEFQQELARAAAPLADGQAENAA
jgi:geranylgeranyl pyrophosphate synthase